MAAIIQDDSEKDSSPSMINFLLNASRPVKRFISVSYDLAAIPVAVYLALALRHGTLLPPIGETTLLATLITSVITTLLFVKLGLYRAVVRFMTGTAFTTLGLGVTVSALVLATSSFLTQAAMPRSSLIIYLFTSFTLLGIPRLFIRSVVSQLSKAKAEPVIIYGAGNQGVALVNALSGSQSYHPNAFIDDCEQKQKITIHGLKVHAPAELEALSEKYGARKVLLALGRTGMSQRKALIEKLTDLQLEILTAPSVTDIINGKARVEEVREVEIEDLLGRDCVTPREDLLASNIEGKIVLITGAGGSIGSELSRQALLKRPHKLILLELNEYSLYAIEQELIKTKAASALDTQIIPILGSVQKQNRLENIFRSFRVDTIYHAAAYKHVPMVEHNVVEGVRNNVFGTWYCAEAAIAAGVERFVLISTDKAVRPTNVMGASKRLAELVLQALSERQSDTLFCMVRFGNVLGSSGSVVPLFRKQIREGGPITVTHPDIIRYFMTIPEASQLVIQAGAMGKGGDVFVLDMGEPVKITDLARKMIRLSGLTERTAKNPNGDIDIQFSGLRPGEKLYEELLVGENVEGTDHPRIMTANEVHLGWPETHNLINRLDRACHEFRVEDVIKLLLEAPAAYTSQGHSPDWVLNASQG